LSDFCSPPRRRFSASGAGAIYLQVVLLLAIMVTPAAAGQERATARLVLRVYNVFGLSELDLETARTTVREVFDQAGVQTTWRNCLSTGHDPCSERPAANEIVVRLIRSPYGVRLSTADLTLGYSSVQPELHRGSFTTVYPDRVATIAQRFGRDPGLLLGRAIAHELGHLLFGTTTHAASGLMRARWSGRPMQDPVPEDWVFSAIEARQLRDAILARTTEPAPLDRIAAIEPTAARGSAKTFSEH
jgi:hypothetical protein